MIAAGLAGTSPHMISATITALSRVVFEFKGTLAATPSISISNYLHRNYIDHHAIRGLHHAPRLPHLREPRNSQVCTWLC